MKAMKRAGSARTSALSACIALTACTDLYRPSEAALQTLERNDAEVSLLQALKTGWEEEGKPYDEVLTGESGFCFTPPTKARWCCKYSGTPAPEAAHVSTYNWTQVTLAGCASASQEPVERKVGLLGGVEQLSAGVVKITWTGTQNQQGDRFVDALHALARSAATGSAEDAEFSRAARERSPESLPEKARAHKVAAEDAVREKRYPDAVQEYGEALRLAPWWPQGHFNRALILAELGANGAAGREMKRYLVLVPDAENARQAQDKIYSWQAKVK